VEIKIIHIYLHTAILFSGVMTLRAILCIRLQVFECLYEKNEALIALFKNVGDKDGKMLTSFPLTFFQPQFLLLTRRGTMRFLTTAMRGELRKG